MLEMGTSAYARARIGTSAAAKRLEAIALAAERVRLDEAERRRRAEEEVARQALAERQAYAEQDGGWEAKQVEAWALRQPGVTTMIKPRWRTIVGEVADKHGLTVEEILSHARARKFTRPRFEAMYRLFDETPLSLPEIGRRLGGRDHTTVLHGMHRHAELNGLPVPRQDEEDA